MTEEHSINRAGLFHELEWLKRAMRFRLLAPDDPITEISPPILMPDNAYGQVLQKYGLNICERLVLALALAPHIDSGILDMFFNNSTALPGAVKSRDNKRGFPTAQHALFLVGGRAYRQQLSFLDMFAEGHVFRKSNLLTVETVEQGQSELSGALIASSEIVDLFTHGYVRPPRYGNDFPAKHITTKMTWNDLVLAAVTKRQVEEVKVWLRHREKLFTEFGMSKRIKPGYKVLFYGAPGTGKTLTACLLGQYTERHVLRVDLSMVVSKYIGETEKNLAKVFDKAEHSDWILFFDEADALFGARTKVSGSHDRYANQEVSYLLQRIEDYAGIVILASNMKGNIDDAFMRRFTSVVHFPFPKSEERQQLWQRALPQQLAFSGDVDVKKLADRYEMSGANITNIAAWCALIALEKGDMQVTDSILREGIGRELAKEGRTL